MTDIVELPAPDDRPPRLRRLLILLLPLLALAAGFGSSFMGLWSPLSLGGSPEMPEPAVPEVTFVEVPRLILTLPGERTQTLALSVMIEVAPGRKAMAETLMPRIIDSFNEFLSRIDSAAFSRRGILEIVRAELATRTAFILGGDTVRDLLITEFRIQ